MTVKWIKLFDEMITEDQFISIYDKTDENDLISRLELMLAYHESDNYPYESNLQKLLTKVLDKLYEYETKQEKLVELVNNLWRIIENKDKQKLVLNFLIEPEWNIPDGQDDATMLGLREKNK